jgi:hypothetical protein
MQESWCSRLLGLKARLRLTFLRAPGIGEEEVDARRTAFRYQASPG